MNQSGYGLSPKIMLVGDRGRAVLNSGIAVAVSSACAEGGSVVALIPDPFVPVVKELCYSMLSGPLPDGEARPGMQSVVVVFAELARFLTWLRDRPQARCRQLSTLLAADLTDYQRHLLLALPDKPVVRRRARAAIRRLWRWRGHLAIDRLSFDPIHIDGWGEAHHRQAENSTDRIPEPFLGALLTWALRFVDTFSADILAAYHYRLREPLQPPVLSTPRTQDVAQRLSQLLDAHLADNKPLPGYGGRPNQRQIGRLLRCDPGSLKRHRAQIADAVAVVGLGEGIAVDAPITATLEGQPWVTAISTDIGSYTAPPLLARMLQIACLIVISYLSGMRDCEIKHLRRGCVRIEHDENGRPYRWKVDSLAFKGEDDRSGVPATWRVGQPAVRAIAILEALQPAHNGLLFAHLPDSHPDRPDRAMSNATTNKGLNAFLRWIDRYCVDRGRADTVPAVAGRAWRLTTRQFRRTLAWHIARRPGGTIAGALQYRHHGIQMFEGYAGTSESGFRAEVESEQALARGEHYMTMIDANEHAELAGPAAAEAARRLDSFGERARFQGQVVLDEQRLLRIVKRHDPAIYPGEYVTCVHDHAKALCVKAQRGRAEQLPDHGSCKPLACRNVALTTANVTAWRRELERIDQRLETPPPLPPFLAHQVRQRRATIQKFLTDTEPAGPTA